MQPASARHGLEDPTSWTADRRLAAIEIIGDAGPRAAGPAGGAGTDEPGIHEPGTGGAGPLEPTAAAIGRLRSGLYGRLGPLVGTSPRAGPIGSERRAGEVRVGDDRRCREPGVG